MHPTLLSWYVHEADLVLSWNGLRSPLLISAHLLERTAALLLRPRAIGRCLASSGHDCRGRCSSTSASGTRLSVWHASEIRPMTGDGSAVKIDGQAEGL